MSAPASQPPHRRTAKARTRWVLIAALAASVLQALLAYGRGHSADASVVADRGAPGWRAQLDDKSDGRDWPAYGRTFGEQHFSPLAQINASNVGRLGLVWSLDLPPGNAATGPIEVGGVLYFASGYSIVHAVDVATGKLLWVYDPKVTEVAGKKLRAGFGSRGIAYWNGKIFTGAHDGRLIAIDAATGKPLWSATTFGKDEDRYITGPPRAFDGMVIIGHGGADSGSVRGYVTAYDAETGKQKWRFFVVPGNPADGFESPAMAMAAKTWAGEWWKYGGGGTVWNAITYDRESDTIYLGTGNGAPWNHKIRSAGKGDNLFLCSIVALDARTGTYKWHYQINPAESWDYNAAMDMQLADLRIDGKPRKVLMTAPKNGFFYVIDRLTGKLLSAEPFVDVTWAKRIDLKTGRPIEMPNLRYENGSVTFRPSPIGAHSWPPMAFSPQSGLVYIPAMDVDVTFSDAGITAQNWRRRPGMAVDGAVYGMPGPGAPRPVSELVAWNPVTQKAAWRRPSPGLFNGGTMATGGGLVFQGNPDASFLAYDASTGNVRWRFDAKAGVMAPPITYSVKGRQYVTVIAGFGTSGGLWGGVLEPYGIDYRTQARRVLTFALDGKATLPPKIPYRPRAPADPEFRSDDVAATAGLQTYHQYCVACHGLAAQAAGTAPDLRTSTVIQSGEAFASVVHDGALEPNGMPKFDDLGQVDRENIRQYLRTRAQELRSRQP